MSPSGPAQRPAAPPLHLLPMNKSLTAVLGATLLPCLVLAQETDSPPVPTGFAARPAIFTVTTDIVNTDVQPFTVTGTSFGDNLKRDGKGGFEPLSFRGQYIADRDSPDRIYAGAGAGIGRYDSYASGILDGAGIRVYRIVDGRLKLVRTDRVTEGGSIIEEWNSAGKVIPPLTLSATYKWDDWTRPNARRWFSVVAINTDGVRSAPAHPVKLGFTKATKEANANNPSANFTAPRKLEGLPPPGPVQNLQAKTGPDSLVHLSWTASPSPGIVGYYILYTDTDPEHHRGAYLQLASQPAKPDEAIQAGDMIFVAKDMAPFRPEYLSNRLGGLDRIIRDWLPTGVPNSLLQNPDSWSLVRHAPDTPVQDGGQTYFEMPLPAGRTEKVGLSGIPDLSTTRQVFYPVPAETEYTMEVWLKADRAGAPPVVFEYDGDARVGGFIKPHPMQTTTSWKKFTHTFTGRPAHEGLHAYLVLTCTGAATYSVDNFRVYRSDTRYLDYDQNNYARLRESGMAAYRTHHSIKTGHNSYSMDQFTGPNGSVEGVVKGISLGGVLTTIHTAGLRPWLQIEFHMSPEEWLGFAEFMAAPYDPAKDSPQSKPWAYKRYQQGHPAPWTDSFDRIYFELGNETWNSLFFPWTFPSMKDSATGQTHSRGSVYGMMHDHVVATLRSSPYWTKEVEAKFTYMMGGWAIGSYNNEIAAATTTGDFITIGAYNGGWDEGEGPPQRNPATFFSVLNFANQTTLPRSRGLINDAIKWEQKTGRHFQLGTYEAGPGYALNGLNNAQVSKEQAAEQERVMKSKAAGVATLDSFLAMAAYDFDIQNFFTYSEGNYWSSHAKPYAGGYAHPSFQYLSLFNREATGDMLHISTDSTPTVDLPAFKRRKAIEGAPATAAYATRDGDRVNVFVISRRYPGYPVGSGDGFTPFGLQLPFTKAAAITLHRLTGAPDDSNLDDERVKVESVRISANVLRTDGKFVINADTGGDPRGLPPAEAYLYVFEGTNIAKTGKELTREEIAAQPITFGQK